MGQSFSDFFYTSRQVDTCVEKKKKQICERKGGRERVKRYSGKKKRKGPSLMSFGGFLENSTGGGGARVVVDIPYSNGNGNNHHNMPAGALVQPRLVTPPLTKSMFNSSPGLSLGLVRLHSDRSSLYHYQLPSFFFLFFLGDFFLLFFSFFCAATEYRWTSGSCG